MDVQCALNDATVTELDDKGKTLNNFGVPGLFVDTAATQSSVYLLSSENLTQFRLGGTSDGTPTGTPTGIWNREVGDTLHCVAAAGNKVAVLSTANNGGTATVTILYLGNGNTVQSLE